MTRFIELGSGGAWPDGDRNPPGHLILGESSRPLLVDCGSGATGQLVRAGVQPKDLGAILLTHIHIDHCLDLAGIVFGAFLTGRTDALKVYGPPGVEAMVRSLFDQTFPFAPGMMQSLRGVELNVQAVELQERQRTELVEGVSGSGYLVKHGIATYGYRLEIDKNIVAVSGDTEPCDSLLELATGADLLVQDCAWPDDGGPRPGHCIPEQVNTIARDAAVETVLLHHMFPPCKGKEGEMIESASRDFSGRVIMASDLQEISVGH